MSYDGKELTRLVRPSHFVRNNPKHKGDKADAANRSDPLSRALHAWNNVSNNKMEVFPREAVEK